MRYLKVWIDDIEIHDTEADTIETIEIEPVPLEWNELPAHVVQELNTYLKGLGELE